MGWVWRAGRLCLVWAAFPSFCRLAFLMGEDQGPPGSEASTAGQHGLFSCLGWRKMFGVSPSMLEDSDNLVGWPLGLLSSTEFGPSFPFSTQLGDLGAGEGSARPLTCL